MTDWRVKTFCFCWFSGQAIKLFEELLKMEKIKFEKVKKEKKG